MDLLIRRRHLTGPPPERPTVTYIFTQASAGTANIYYPNNPAGISSRKVDGEVVSGKTVSVLAGQHTVELVIPSGVLPSTMFQNMTAITTVVLTGPWINFAESCFRGCSGITSCTLYLPTLATLSNRYTFLDCSNLEGEVDFPELLSAVNYGHFQGCKKITKVRSLGHLTALPDSMFSGCSALTDVTLPSGLTSFSGSQHFYNCSALVNCTLSLPYLTTIGGRYTFNGCPNLTGEINFPSLTTISGDSHFVGSKITKILSLGSITSIPAKMFYQCKSLTDVNIPTTTTNIGQGSFYNCTSLTSVSLTGCITITGGTSGGQGAFRDCTSLAAVTFGNNLTSIGDLVFAGCTNLVTADLPSSTTTLGVGVFNGCTKLTGILNLPNLTSIGNYAFLGTKITKITSLGSITRIPGGTASSQGTFRNCTSLTEVTLPSTLTSIEANAFANCTNLETCTISQSVTSIGQGAFNKCKLAQEVTLPNIASIGDTAFFQTKITKIVLGGTITTINGGTGAANGTFSGCTALTYVDLPSTITTIVRRAFYNCSNLTTFIIRATTPPSLGSDSLSGTPSAQKIYVPNGCGAAYQGASVWSNYSSRINELDVNGNIPT